VKRDSTATINDSQIHDVTRNNVPW